MIGRWKDIDKEWEREKRKGREDEKERGKKRAHQTDLHYSVLRKQLLQVQNYFNLSPIVNIM